jgi:hypothetical protein
MPFDAEANNLKKSEPPVRSRWRFAWSLRTLILLIGLFAVFFAYAAPKWRRRPELWENRSLHEFLAGDPTTEVHRLDPNGPIKTKKNRGAVVIYEQYPIAKKNEHISREARARLFSQILDKSSYSPFKVKYGHDWHYRIRVKKDGKAIDFFVDTRTPCVMVMRNEFISYLAHLSPEAQASIVSELEAALKERPAETKVD